MLIVLRGNSGSGKTTVARELQTRLRGSVAVLQQDHFRRIVYRERVGEGTAHIDLIDVVATHCLSRGDHVILEGIFDAEIYEPFLSRVAEQTDDARFYAFDLSLEETMRRHATRPQSTEFTAAEMRDWYRGWQPLSFVDERRIGPESTVDETVTRILTNR